MTEKIDFHNCSNLHYEFKKIIDKNCKEIPYEGMEINKEGIIEDILEYLNKNHYSLLKHTKVGYC